MTQVKAYFRLIVLVSIFFPLQALADNRLLSFALDYESFKTGFNFSGTNYDTQFNLLGVSWFEPFQSYFHAGLEAGGFEMTQRSNNVASARFTRGEYAGVIFRFIPYSGDFIQLNLNFNYRYNRAIGELSNQKTVFNWHHRLASIKAIFKLTESNKLVLTTNQRLISGDQVNTGAINSNQKFVENQSLGHSFGWVFHNSSRGTIAINIIEGYQQGFTLSFNQGF